MAISGSALLGNENFVASDIDGFVLIPSGTAIGAINPIVPQSGNFILLVSLIPVATQSVLTVKFGSRVLMVGDLKDSPSSSGDFVINSIGSSNNVYTTAGYSPPISGKVDETLQISTLAMTTTDIRLYYQEWEPA